MKTIIAGVAKLSTASAPNTLVDKKPLASSPTQKINNLNTNTRNKVGYTSIKNSQPVSRHLKRDSIKNNGSNSSC